MARSPLVPLMLLAYSLLLTFVDSSESETLSRSDIPGRPLQGHIEKSIKLIQFHPNPRRSGSADGLSLQAYIVKVEREKRSEVVAAIKILTVGVVLQYLPHDSYIAVLSHEVAEEVAQLDGVQTMLLLPREMKVSPELLDSIQGTHTGPVNRRVMKMTNSDRAFSKSRPEINQLSDTMTNSTLLKSGGSGPISNARTVTEQSKEATAFTQVDLVVVVGRAGRTSNASFETEWTKGMIEAGLGSSVVGILDEGRGSVIVRTNVGQENAVASVVRWLIARGEVVFVQRKSSTHLLKVEQTEAVRNSAETALRNLGSVHTLLGGIGEGGEPLVWSRGIRGEGQVIAIADSGLDFDHCALSDDARLISFCADQETCENPGRHRKVFSYRVFNRADVGDEEDGHGTHVVGAAMADTLNADGFEMTGAAPGAKVAFEDGGRESARTEEGRAALRFPELMEDLFDPSFGAGVRVHSDSWGTDSRLYETLSQDVDAYMFDHPDFLVVLAAGNDGEEGYVTIGAPALSKNAIAVGASENEPSAYPASTGAEIAQIQVDASANGGKQRGILQFAEFGLPEAAGRGVIQRQRLVMAESGGDGGAGLGCEALGNAAAVEGHVALLRRGECAFQRKCANAQAAGAIACVVANNVEDDALVVMAADAEAPGVLIPSVFVAKASGDALESLLGDGEVLVSLPVYPFETSNVASFSSRGPTFDMRIKPDIVAAGEQVLSARGDADLTSNQCSDESAAVYLSGTSMAAPQVAGAAALVREYFEGGYHESGSRNPAAGFTPSAALVKSVILHSGEQLAYPKKATPDMGLSGPDFDQGYGGLRLSSALWFGDEVSGFRFAALDRQELSDGEAWGLCLSDVDPSLPLRVTLHWTDPPGSQIAQYALVNNLDLSVEHTGSGSRRFGNALPGTTSAGAPMPVLDSVNNNEQVTWAVPEGGQYRVLVSGHDIPLGPQKFAVVVTGSFASAAPCPVDAGSSCPGGGVCSGHGTCMPGGFCECAPTHGGADCSEENAVLRPGAVTTTPPVGVSGWLYYVIPVYGDQSWALKATSLDAAAGADPDLYVAYGRVPTLEDFDGGEFSAGGATSLTLGFEDMAQPPRLESAGDGYWVVGVFAYCCAAARIEISVTMGPSSRPDRDIPADATESPDTAGPTPPPTPEVPILEADNGPAPVPTAPESESDGDVTPEPEAPGEQEQNPTQPSSTPPSLAGGGDDGDDPLGESESERASPADAAAQDQDQQSGGEEGSALPSSALMAALGLGAGVLVLAVGLWTYRRSRLSKPSSGNRADLCYSAAAAAPALPSAPPLAALESHVPADPPRRPRPPPPVAQPAPPGAYRHPVVFAAIPAHAVPQSPSPAHALTGIIVR